MIRSSRTLFAAVCALVMALCTPAFAQDAPDPLGEWSGVLNTPQGEITLIVYVARDEDGALTAELESPNQAPGQMIPVTEISVEDAVLNWRIAAIGASFEGVWNAQDEQWQGTFNQGLELPLNLSRGLPDAGAVVEGLDGSWQASIQLGDSTLRLVVNVTTGEFGTIATLDSPDQMAMGLPLSNFARDGQEVSFELALGNQQFAGTLNDEGDAIEGMWESPATPPSALTFTRTSDTVTQAERNRPQTPEAPFPYRVEEVEFGNSVFAEVHLAASLSLPEGDGPFPAAILISGSGAQDRDETLLGHKPFAVLADHLTRHGIAVLRYDDRGVGGSTGDYGAATSADLATDANAAAAFLLTRSDIDHASIGFIGHSEGGMIGPIAMADNDDIAFLVMLAGPGTALDQLMLSQRRLVGSQMGMTEENLDAAEPVMAAIFHAIAGSDSVEAGLEAARTLLTPEAMVALGATADTDPDLVLVQLSTPWFHYFLAYDPAPNLARIDVPVLALNGALDRQVPPADNLAAIEAALTGNSDVTTMQLPSLNHLFQTAETGAVGEYADIEETFAPAALTIISDWLGERFVGE